MRKRSLVNAYPSLSHPGSLKRQIQQPFGGEMSSVNQLDNVLEQIQTWPAEAVVDPIVNRLLSFNRALTAADVADVLSISKATVHRFCQDRTIPFFRVGKQIRFSPKAIIEWWEARQRPMTKRVQ
jgi:excisionase family DNA binding protein